MITKFSSTPITDNIKDEVYAEHKILTDLNGGISPKRLYIVQQAYDALCKAVNVPSNKRLNAIQGMTIVVESVSAYTFRMV